MLTIIRASLVLAIVSLLVTPAHARGRIWNWRSYPTTQQTTQPAAAPTEPTPPAPVTATPAPPKPEDIEKTHKETLFNVLGSVEKIEKATPVEGPFTLLGAPKRQIPVVAPVVVPPPVPAPTTEPAPAPAPAPKPKPAPEVPDSVWKLTTRATPSPLVADDKYPPPVPEIVGAESPIPYGEVVQLWVKPLTKKPDHLHSVTYAWSVLPQKNFVVWPDSTRILFGSGTKPQTYAVVLNASYVFVVPGEGSKSEIVQRSINKVQTVQIGDGAAAGPDELPPATPNLTGTAKQVYEWTSTVIVGADYSEETFRNDAALIAKNFGDIAAAIGKNDPKLTSVIEVLRATKKVNDEKINNRAAWTQWFANTSELIQQMNNTGILKTSKDCQSVWVEISEGLMAVATQ